MLRGDLPRLGRCAAIFTGEQGALPRVKPFKCARPHRQHVSRTRELKRSALGALAQAACGPCRCAAWQKRCTGTYEVCARLRWLP